MIKLTEVCDTAEMSAQEHAQFILNVCPDAEIVGYQVVKFDDPISGETAKTYILIKYTT